MSEAAKREALRAITRLDGVEENELDRVAATAEEIVLGPAGTIHERPGSGRTHVILAGTASIEGMDGPRTVGPGTIVGDLADDDDLREGRLVAVTLLHALMVTTHPRFT
jgi:hypothetical protein